MIVLQRIPSNLRVLGKTQEDPIRFHIRDSQIDDAGVFGIWSGFNPSLQID
jgi:hypothetical protein